MTHIGIKALIVLQLIASFHFFFISLVDYPLGNRWVRVHYLSQRVLRNFNNITSSILIGPFLVLVPSATVDITHLCLLVKIARFGSLSWNFKLLLWFLGIHGIFNIERFLGRSLTEFYGIVVDVSCFILKSLLRLVILVVHLTLPSSDVLSLGIDLDVTRF